MFHGLYVPHVLYPFLWWWASRLLPFPGHCEPRGAWIVVRCLWRCAREWRCGAVWEFRFQLFRRTLRLPSVLAALANVPVRRVGGGALSSTPSPTVIVCGRFEGGCLDQGEVLPRSGSDLPSSNNKWCWASFPVPSCLAYPGLSLSFSPLPPVEESVGL